MLREVNSGKKRNNEYSGDLKSVNPNFKMFGIQMFRVFKWLDTV